MVLLILLECLELVCLGGGDAGDAPAADALGHEPGERRGPGTVPVHDDARGLVDREQRPGHVEHGGRVRRLAC